MWVGVDGNFKSDKLVKFARRTTQPYGYFPYPFYNPIY